MRVHDRRHTALIVAIATITLFTISGPAPAAAATPPGLGRFMNAIGAVESGGDYHARNKTSGAYGKYQIMPSNWPSWARRYLGSSTAPETPPNQERVARGKFLTLFASLKSWRRVAYWWLTGSSKAAGWTAHATGYVDKVMRGYLVASDTIPTGGGGGTVTPPNRFSERSAAVHYTGSWKSAGFRAYAGGRATYATQAGASATFTFTGRGVTWFGPTGPTRGRARILVDGVYLKTVDLARHGFSAHVALFAKTWAARGSHSLTIQVVGGGSHPMVAIDEFVIRR